MNKGFTLIEVMIAIFILTLTVGGLLTLTAGGYFSVRYARNQIVANNLLQESIEYVRNSRDTAFQQGQSWSQWLASFSVDSAGTSDGSADQGCFAGSGCIVDPYTTTAVHVKACNTACDTIAFYPDAGFYGYPNDNSLYPAKIQSDTAYLTSYVRTITMQPGQGIDGSADPNQIVVTATIQWLNGTAKKTAVQSDLITNLQNN